MYAIFEKFVTMKNQCLCLFQSHNDCLPIECVKLNIIVNILHDVVPLYTCINRSEKPDPTNASVYKFVAITDCT